LEGFVLEEFLEEVGVHLAELGAAVDDGGVGAAAEDYLGALGVGFPMGVVAKFIEALGGGAEFEGDRTVLRFVFYSTELGGKAAEAGFELALGTGFGEGIEEGDG
jgi:hypothetical protein